MSIDAGVTLQILHLVCRLCSAYWENTSFFASILLDKVSGSADLLYNVGGQRLRGLPPQPPFFPEL
jgi:hypothetical protein